LKVIDEKLFEMTQQNNICIGETSSEQLQLPARKKMPTTFWIVKTEDDFKKSRRSKLFMSMLKEYNLFSLSMKMLLKTYSFEKQFYQE
jgi:hypothetical protein